MSTNTKNDFDEENYDPTEMEKILKDVNATAYTNVLDNLKFENKMDEMVFNLLPLSKKQKEELVMACAVPDDIKSEYLKIKKLKTEQDKQTDDQWQKRLSPNTSSSNKDDKSFIDQYDADDDDDESDYESLYELMNSIVDELSDPFE